MHFLTGKVDYYQENMNVAKCSTHPLIQDKLTQLRDKNTPPFVFRKLITDIGTLLSYEVALTLEMKGMPLRFGNNIFRCEY